MLPSFVITFREMLEVALVVGVVLGYLSKNNQTKFNNVVYLGIFAGVVASIISALLFQNLAGGFSGSAEEIFEGVTMFVGAGLLTTMIVWMSKQTGVAKQLEARVATRLEKEEKIGLFFLVAVSVLREGVETVIFLSSANIAGGSGGIIGGVLGLVAAAILGYLIFVGEKKVKIKNFFAATTIILVLFSAGLLAHGVHEFQEAGIIKIGTTEVWNINPPRLESGAYPAWHDKGSVGSVFKGLFGYSGHPSRAQIVVWLSYLGVATILLRKKTKPTPASPQP